MVVLMEFMKRTRTDRSTFAGRVRCGHSLLSRVVLGATCCAPTFFALLAVMFLLAGPARAELAGPARAETHERDVRVINMVAERFFFVPSRIKVKQGTTVEFRIRSADTNHGFRIRKAGINVVVPKRGRGEVRVIFEAKEKGRYDFECSKPCGAGHNMMRGTIIVE